MEFLNEIITGCLKNNPKEQRAFYERYYGYCLKIVFRYISRYEHATDVVNDGFVKIFNKLDTFYCEQPGKAEIMMMGWIKVIMVNTAIDRLRKNNFLSEIALTDEGIWAEDNSQVADQSLFYKDLVKEIRRLPPVYRIVFNMYVIEGFTHKEIAEQLNIAVGTSKSNLSKARGLLQNFIKKNDEAKTCYM